MIIKDIDDFADIKEALIAGLNLSPEADFKVQNPLEMEGIDFIPDVVVKDGKKTYIIMIRNLPEQEDISDLALVKSLNPKAFDNNTFVFAAKKITSSFKDLAGRFDKRVKVIQLPYSLPIESLKDDNGKITSEKAWKVIEQLLPPQKMAPSIRRVAQNAEISYGWAHKIVTRLVSRGIVDNHAHFIHIVDVGRLLNAVANERPMARDMEMSRGFIQTEFAKSIDAATALTRMLKNEKIDFAFTAHTAATLYTGYAVKHDSVYLYLEDEQFYRKMKRDEAKTLRGVKVHVYKPDRNVFKEGNELNDVLVVSKPQALLDLAGFGMSTRAIAVDMVNRYDEF